jgi:DNA polymerase-4
VTAPVADRPAATILHVDMDAFFVSVELLDRPELRGRPVIVGGDGRRGVVAAASYEARAFGVHSAMPSLRARRLCPQAVFLPGRYGRYVEVSRRVMALFGTYTPLVEPISLDEAFLDVTGARRLHGDGPAIGRALRERVLDEEGLTCSVGVAPVKFVAKLASEAAKPRATPTGPVGGRGVHVVAPGGVRAFLDPLPVRALWGVGPATFARLERLGIRTVGELAATPLDTVVRALGAASGAHLHALANGVDPRSVEPDRAVKSVGHEETYPDDLTRPEAVGRELVRLADAVAARLRAQGVGGRTVTLKVRFGDFRTITRSATLPAAVDTAAGLLAAAEPLVARVDPGPGIRLLGLSASGLGPPGGARQLSLDLDDGTTPGPAPESWSDAERTVDAIRARFGEGAIGPATLLRRRGLGLGLRRPGTAQWGPGSGGVGGPSPTEAGDPAPAGGDEGADGDRGAGRGGGAGPGPTASGAP